MRYTILTLIMLMILPATTHAGAYGKWDERAMYGQDKYRDHCNASKSTHVHTRYTKWKTNCYFTDKAIVGTLPTKAKRLMKRHWRCKVVKKGKTVCNKGKHKKRFQGGKTGKRGFTMKQMVAARKDAVQWCNRGDRNHGQVSSWSMYTTNASCRAGWDHAPKVVNDLLHGDRTPVMGGLQCRGIKTGGVSGNIPYGPFSVVQCGSGRNMFLLTLVDRHRTGVLKPMRDKYGTWTALK